MVYHLPQPTYVIKTNHDYYLADFDFSRQLPLFADSIDAACYFSKYETASLWLALMNTVCEIETIEPSGLEFTTSDCTSAEAQPVLDWKAEHIRGT